MSDLHLEAGAWSPPPCDAALVLLAGNIDRGAGGIAWAATSFAGRPVLYVAGTEEHLGAPSVEASAAGLAAAAAQTENVRFLEGTELQFHVADRCLRVLGGTLGAENAEDAAGGQAERHRRMLEWLAARLTQPFSGTTIVLTHYAPSLQSLPPHRRGDPAAAGAVNDLDALITRTQPALWVHGHTHHDADYRIGESRIVSHQRISGKNANYQALIVEV